MEQKALLRNAALNTLRASPWLLFLAYIPVFFDERLTLSSVLAALPISLGIAAAFLPIAFLLGYMSERVRTRHR